MVQTDTQTILAVVIFLVLGSFILFWLLDKQCASCQDKQLINRLNGENYNRRGREGFAKKQLPPSHSGPSRMDRIYDSQDYYKSHPFIYPTPNSFVTSTFAIKRELRERGGVYE
jgi:hypothetical protein